LAFADQAVTIPKEMATQSTNAPGKGMGGLTGPSMVAGGAVIGSTLILVNNGSKGSSSTSSSSGS